MMSDSGSEQIAPLQSSSHSLAVPRRRAFFRVLPVLDLMGGRIVRGVAGRRHAYQPIVSRLTASSQPLDVARAFREQFGLEELYLADLDAIAGGPVAHCVYDELQQHGFRLWADAGLRTAADANGLERVERLIAGLETLATPEELQRLCQRFGERIVFSLDLREGATLGNRADWGTNAEDVVHRAVSVGVRSMIVLDLARVGVGNGPGTESLIAQIATLHPDLEVLAGGGVRRPEDLRRLRACGASGVLMASALHDGLLQPGDLQWEIGAR